MAKRGSIVDDMRVSKAGVKGWLAREMVTQRAPGATISICNPKMEDGK